VKVVVVGPADAAAVARTCAPALVPRLADVQPYPARPTELLTAALLAAGVQVELVTLSPSVSTPLLLTEGPLSILVGAFRPGRRARDGFRAERRSLQALLAQTDGEILHAHWTYEFAWSILADRRPRVVTVHDAPLTILRRMPDAYRAVRLGMAYRVRAGSFCGIAVSPYVAERWRKEMLDRRALRIIPNFVSVGHRMAGRPAGDGPRLVSVGDAGRRKNVRSLLRAFRTVRERHLTASLRLVGPGLGVDDPLAAWARDNRVTDGVGWLGRRGHADTLDEMASADVVVHPSLEESFGMSVAEAMAMGLPVVGGRGSGGVPWLLDGGRAGVLVDVRSPGSLAEGVLGLVEDPARAERLGAAAARRVASAFSPESVLRAHLQVYDQVTGRSPDAGAQPAGEEE
jgi:glycosyltransferase involved in cell wall biosynthesis